MFEGIIGQEQVKQTLGAMMTADRIPHALLFTGPWGVGKGELALAMAASLFCEHGPGSPCPGCSSCDRARRLMHPDLSVLFPFRAAPQTADLRAKWADELTAHRKLLSSDPYAPVVYEQSRDIVRSLVEEAVDRLGETSFEGGRKVCVILGADRLNTTTANMLLKILEEPPAGVHFLMTAERTTEVLPTILSRASVIRLRRLHCEEITGYLAGMTDLTPAAQEAAAAAADGSIKRARLLASGQTEASLDRSFTFFRTAALGGPGDPAALGYTFLGVRDQREAEDIINGVVLHVRAVIAHACGREQGDNERSDTYATLAERLDPGALAGLAARLEAGMDMLGRNVNIAPVLTTIAYDIHDTFGHHRRAGLR